MQHYVCNILGTGTFMLTWPHLFVMGEENGNFNGSNISQVKNKDLYLAPEVSVEGNVLAQVG